MLCLIRASPWCTIADVTRSAWRQMDSIMQREGENTSWSLLFTACPPSCTHMHTYHQQQQHRQSGKHATVHTSSTLRTQHRWFRRGSLGSRRHAGSCRPIGFRRVSLQITREEEKTVTFRGDDDDVVFFHTHRQVAGVSRLIEGVLRKANRDNKANFSRLHIAPQRPSPLISAPCPEGAITVYYTYPHFMTPPPPLLPASPR